MQKLVVELLVQVQQQWMIPTSKVLFFKLLQTLTERRKKGQTQLRLQPSIFDLQVSGVNLCSPIGLIKLFIDFHWVVFAVCKWKTSALFLNGVWQKRQVMNYNINNLIRHWLRSTYGNVFWNISSFSRQRLEKSYLYCSWHDIVYIVAGSEAYIQSI